MKENKQSKTPDITFGKALLCIIGLIIVLALGFAIIGFDTKVTFLMASIVVGIFLVAYGYKLDQVLLWYADGCRGAIDVILILMSVGTVIGTWMASGTIPTVIYYGLKLLTPTTFMIIGFLLCCLVSFFVGSSYSTLATLGVATLTYAPYAFLLWINPIIAAVYALIGFAQFKDKGEEEQAAEEAAAEQ